MKSPIKLVLALGAILLGALLLRGPLSPAQAAGVSTPGFPAVPYGGDTTIYTDDGKSVDGTLKGINQDWVVIELNGAELWVARSSVRSLRIARSR